MKLELFDYDLPETAIAQYPIEPRDAAKLMVIDRTTGSIEDHIFSQLPTLLKRGDLLVFNDSRVIRARLRGHKLARQNPETVKLAIGVEQKASTQTQSERGAEIELLLAQPLQGHDINSSDWLALARPARRLKVGDAIVFADSSQRAEILAKRSDGTVEIRFTGPAALEQLLEEHGEMPLPPYIKTYDDERDRERYQTIYSQEPGSVAAPTAGLHFTKQLIHKCQEIGIQTVHITLHVGLGTFKPVQAENVEDHLMHEEYYHISDAAAEIINQAHNDGRRIICVGTTSVRTLESAAVVDPSTGVATIQPGWDSTEIFIYPGYHYKMVDALITNFHLPQSTLIMLVSAFYNREAILQAYTRAVGTGYRFFSYGDAMLLL